MRVTAGSSMARRRRSEEEKTVKKAARRRSRRRLSVSLSARAPLSRALRNVMRHPVRCSRRNYGVLGSVRVRLSIQVRRVVACIHRIMLDASGRALEIRDSLGTGPDREAIRRRRRRCRRKGLLQHYDMSLSSCSSSRGSCDDISSRHGWRARTLQPTASRENFHRTC